MKNYSTGITATRAESGADSSLDSRPELPIHLGFSKIGSEAYKNPILHELPEDVIADDIVISEASTSQNSEGALSHYLLIDLERRLNYTNGLC